jgi:predicted RNA-binding protein with PUA-like domain
MPKATPAAAPASTGFWILKSEPESYSIDQFAKDKKTLWTGVRNYQARNFMRDSMKPGDRFFFYHSNAEPSAIVGIGEVVRPNRPDPTALDSKSDYYDPKASNDHPIWFCAEVKFVSKLKRAIALDELKGHKALAGLSLLAKGQRLSVLPVKKAEFEFILGLSK